MLQAAGVTTVDDRDGYALRCLCRTADVRLCGFHPLVHARCCLCFSFPPEEEQ